MQKQPDPAILQSLIGEMEKLVRRAFADGYRHGTTDAVDRMARAAAYGADAALPLLSGQNQGGTNRPLPDRVSGQTPPRPYRYGSVIGKFRQALLAAPGTGLSKENFVEFCARLGTEITPYQAKDVLKRLLANGEAERQDGLYYPGPKLQPLVDPVAHRSDQNRTSFTEEEFEPHSPRGSNGGT